MLKKAKQGKSVDEDEIPPQVALTTTKKATPAQLPQASAERETPPQIFEPTKTSRPAEPVPKPLPAPRKAAPAPPHEQPQSSEGSSDGMVIMFLM